MDGCTYYAFIMIIEDGPVEVSGSGNKDAIVIAVWLDQPFKPVAGRGNNGILGLYAPVIFPSLKIL